MVRVRCAYAYTRVVIKYTYKIYKLILMLMLQSVSIFTLKMHSNQPAIYKSRPIPIALKLL
jgi:hypothetical protein